jgi:hypothetical protein
MIFVGIGADGGVVVEGGELVEVVLIVWLLDEIWGGGHGGWKGRVFAVVFIILVLFINEGLVFYFIDIYYRVFFFILLYIIL